MEIWEALKLGLRQYATFYGNTNRPDYWYFILGLAIIGTVFSILSEDLGIAFNVATLVPWLSASARRLRDAGVSRQNFWWLALPIVGWIIFIIRLTAPTKN